MVYGRRYRLRASFSRPDGKFGMRVKRCLAFSDTNNTVELVDARGCADPDVMSNFRYRHLRGVAEAELFSMFKFPESNRVHFQCDILVCKGPCRAVDCEETVPQVRELPTYLVDAQTRRFQKFSTHDGISRKKNPL